MNLNDCSQERNVLAALANGAVPDDLNEHLNACAICQDARLVWNYLHSDDLGEQPELPSPDAIWWRAQLAKKRAAAQRSVAAINVMQSIALAAAIIGVIAIAIWQSAKLAELPVILLAGTAATLLVLVASIVFVLTSARHAHSRTSLRGM